MEQSFLFENNYTAAQQFPPTQAHICSCRNNASRSKRLADFANIMQIAAAGVAIIAFLYSMFKGK
jgi:hypothetical protein